MSDKTQALRLAEWLDGAYEGDAQDAAAELRRLHDECEALRKDAERYRFLRRHYVSSYWARGSLADLDNEIDEARTIPKAIDAARNP